MNTAERITKEEIFGIETDHDFNVAALRVFKFQYNSCIPYREFCDHIKCDVKEVKHYHQIPFLPIQLFKSYKIGIGDDDKIEKVFKSSGTTAFGRSEHHVQDVTWYEESFINGFHHFYGDPAQFTFIALLPSYLEQGDSSLVYMVKKLVQVSHDNRSGFL
jgi:hypothetical protein